MRGNSNRTRCNCGITCGIIKTEWNAGEFQPDTLQRRHNLREFYKGVLWCSLKELRGIPTESVLKVTELAVELGKCVDYSIVNQQLANDSVVGI